MRGPARAEFVPLSAKKTRTYACVSDDGSSVKNHSLPLVIVPEDPALEQRVREAVIAVCDSRQKVTDNSGKRVQLTSRAISALVNQMIVAASQAASGPLPNRARTRGAPQTMQG